MKTPLIFYCPNYLELLFDFFGPPLKIDIHNVTKSDKKKVLFIIERMLEQKVIEVGEFDENQTFNTWNLTTPTQTILKIDSIWTSKTTFPDYYNIVWFKYKNWYINKLKELDYDSFNDWSDFIEEKIGNIDNWILENKPN